MELLKTFQTAWDSMNTESKIIDEFKQKYPRPETEEDAQKLIESMQDPMQGFCGLTALILFSSL